MTFQNGYDKIYLLKMEELFMTNGERIKYLREKSGLTQKDVATRLGLEPAAISKYELDMREPNIEAIKKFLISA